MQRMLNLILLCLLLASARFAAALPAFNEQAIEQKLTQLSGLTQFQVPTRRIVVFGDSLSDSEGRSFRYTKGAIPPALLYWRGRASNGPVWVEYLSAALGVPLVNYAHAGARLRDYNNYGVLPPLLKQLWAPPASYQLALADRDQLQLNEEDLVIVWIGNNDFMFQPEAAQSGLYMRLTEELVQSLVQRGAKRLILVANSDISAAPHVLNGGGKLPVATLHKLVSEHNIALQDWIRTMRSAALHLDYISFEGFMGGVIKNPAVFGIEDARTPCLPGVSLPLKIPFPPLPPLIAKKVLESCPRPSTHFFWDSWHPTTKVHCLGAIEALRQWSDAGQVQRFSWQDAERLCLDHE